jgi:hypothetical protein
MPSTPDPDPGTWNGSPYQLHIFENFLFAHILMRRNSSEDRIQRPDSERIMCWNGDSMGRWLLSLQYYVASNLMDSLVSPTLAKVLNQVLSA